MFGEILGGDDHVVDVNENLSGSNFFFEHFRHHPLEGGGGVTKAEEHDEWLVETTIGLEGRLVLISWVESNVVVTQPDVQFGKVPGILEVIDYFIDEWEGIVVFDSDLVEPTIVLDRTEMTILLFDEEERGSHWWLRWSNVSGPQLFIQELVELVLLFSRQWVDLAVELVLFSWL
jgi:hypothetical protein